MVRATRGRYRPEVRTHTELTVNSAFGEAKLSPLSPAGVLDIYIFFIGEYLLSELYIE